MTLSALIRTGLSPADHGLGGMFGLARGADRAGAGRRRRLYALPQEPWWRTPCFHSAIEAIKHIKTWLPPSLATWLPYCLLHINQELSPCVESGSSGGAGQPAAYDSLLLLQHRGQDAAGIATSQGNQFNMYKAHGLVRDVFRTRNMRALPGTSGVGQVRYPTAGCQRGRGPAFLRERPVRHHVRPQRQPDQLARAARYRVDRRHINNTIPTPKFC